MYHPKALVLASALTGALAAALWQAHTPESFAAAERARLRAHFESVERELRAEVVPGLTLHQRVARARLLDNLRAYRLRGIFPRNTDFPQDTSVFIDYWGKRCGVAYLMEQSGNEDLVLRIAATHNNARVPELKDDPEVARWLATNGITLAEATRIQPTYGCGTLHPDRGPPCSSPGYRVATGVVVAGNVATFTLNLLHGASRQVGGMVGVGSGVAGIVVGAPNIGGTGSRGTLGLLNTGVGAASLTLGLVRVINSPRAETRSHLRVAPWVGPRGATGLAAALQF